MTHRQSVAESEIEWFPSEVDWWLRVILVAMPIVALATLVVGLIDGEGMVAAVLACAFIAGLYVAVVYPVRYGFDQEHLIVRFGVFRRRVPYARIRSVRPTWNPLSSPALSLRRLRVDYGEGLWSAALISPKHRDAFLDALAQRTGMPRSGDRLGT